MLWEQWAKQSRAENLSSLNKYLSSLCAPGTVLGSGPAVMSKMEPPPPSLGFSWWRMFCDWRLCGVGLWTSWWIGQDVKIRGCCCWWWWWWGHNWLLTREPGEKNWGVVFRLIRKTNLIEYFALVKLASRYLLICRVLGQEIKNFKQGQKEKESQKVSSWMNEKMHLLSSQYIHHNLSSPAAGHCNGDWE